MEFKKVESKRSARATPGPEDFHQTQGAAPAQTEATIIHRDLKVGPRPAELPRPPRPPYPTAPARPIMPCSPSSPGTSKVGPRPCAPLPGSPLRPGSPLLAPAGCCHLRARVWAVAGTDSARSREEAAPGLLGQARCLACCWAPGGALPRGCAPRCPGGCPLLMLPAGRGCRVTVVSPGVTCVFAASVRSAPSLCSHLGVSCLCCCVVVGFCTFSESSGFSVARATAVLRGSVASLPTAIRRPRSQGPTLTAASGWRAGPSALRRLICLKAGPRCRFLLGASLAPCTSACGQPSCSLWGH